MRGTACSQPWGTPAMLRKTGRRTGKGLRTTGIRIQKREMDGTLITKTITRVINPEISVDTESRYKTQKRCSEFGLRA